jgi:hypothetical protein
MPAQLDLSLLDTIKDPELRASIVRLSNAIDIIANKFKFLRLSAVNSKVV